MQALSSLSNEDFHQEVITPTGNLAFSFDALF